MTTAISHEIAARPGHAERLRALDALLARPARELERIYRNARTPRIPEVEGDLRGRMLAWPSLEAHPAIASAIRTFAGSGAFPWRGKSFRPFDEDRGEGINRVFADRLRLFRFDTSIARSRAGDFDALQLDYDLDANPSFVRRIKDEIREIEPGVWLGQAYFVSPRRQFLWLYFGLAKREV
jgi:hypothetical protein